MSFSIDTKEELGKLNNLDNIEYVKAELNGYILSSNSSLLDERIYLFSENINTFERCKKLLKKLKINFETQKRGKLYYTSYIKKEDIYSNDINIEDDEILKAILRGVFMASGSINNPNKKYHLEILTSTKEKAKFITYIINKFNINSKILKKEKNYCIYVKEGEAISNFLALIGANKSVLNFEEIRVLRDIKNNINRLVNCETANLNKIINVAVNQINDINYIIKRNKFEELPDALKEIAKIRLENEDLSLEQMGKMLDKPIGKSGVNHRFRKINQIANELRKDENI